MESLALFLKWFEVPILISLSNHHDQLNLVTSTHDAHMIWYSAAYHSKKVRIYQKVQKKQNWILVAMLTNRHACRSLLL